ncbi:MAG: phosphorylase family protein, partial [Gammaproteobacteria bacterium]
MDLTTSNSGIKICIVCAMEDEARQFSRALRKYPAPATVSIDVVQTGIGPTRVCAALTNILHTRPDGILIFGTAAGLDESLDAGDTVLYVDVVSETGKNFSTSVRLTDYLAAVLKPLTPRRGAGRTSNTPVCTPAAKAHLHESTGSQCVDMESATVATFAHWHNIPIAAVRVVVDSASETIPSAALAGMQEDGRAN